MRELGTVGIVWLADDNAFQITDVALVLQLLLAQTGNQLDRGAGIADHMNATEVLEQSITELRQFVDVEHGYPLARKNQATTTCSLQIPGPFDPIN